MQARQQRPLWPQFLILIVWLWVLDLGSKVIGWQAWKTIPYTLIFRLAPGKIFKQTRVSREYLLPSFQCLSPTFVFPFSRVRFPSLSSTPHHHPVLVPFLLPCLLLPGALGSSNSCHLCLQPLQAAGVSWTSRRKQQDYTLIPTKLTVQPWHLQKTICQHQEETGNGLIFIDSNPQEGGFHLVLISMLKAHP